MQVLCVEKYDTHHSLRVPKKSNANRRENTMEVRYDFGEMLRRAAKMEAELPRLLADKKWCLIEKTVEIPQYVWEGPAAIAYHTACERFVKTKDYNGIRLVPQMIRDAVTQMQEKGIARANAVTTVYSN